MGIIFINKNYFLIPNPPNFCNTDSLKNVLRNLFQQLQLCSLQHYSDDSIPIFHSTNSWITLSILYLHTAHLLLQYILPHVGNNTPKRIVNEPIRTFIFSACLTSLPTAVFYRFTTITCSLNLPTTLTSTQYFPIPTF